MKWLSNSSPGGTSRPSHPFPHRRYGERVGEDEFGNVYYRAKGGKIDPALGFNRRWVIFNGVAEGSNVPPGWYGWLHHMTDTPPSSDDYKPREWEKPYIPNQTGTPNAWRPQGSTLATAPGRRRPATTRPGRPTLEAFCAQSDTVCAKDFLRDCFSPAPCPVRRGASGRRSAARAPTTIHQSHRDLRRPRQDHRAHHLLRRRHRRDRAVRHAADHAARLHHPSADRGAAHRRLCRGRRHRQRQAGQADFFRLDVRRQPRPAWRRASRL